MSSSWGKQLKISVFGESHGPAVGVVMDGLPASETIDTEALLAFMDRRRPGKNRFSTQRSETDEPIILSGVYQNKTTGTPLTIMIKNSDTHSSDYTQMAQLARPSHGDYTGYLRYNGANDPRGGGHFSGRLTAPLTAAGGIALQILAHMGITVGAHLSSIGPVCDRAYDPVALTADDLHAAAARPFPVLDEKIGEEMQQLIEECRMSQDSVGGIVECAVLGFPAGIGSPMFDGLENRIASLLFGVPAVKGVSFGDGFDIAGKKGSEMNDPFRIKDGKVVTSTNHNGGILGGISSGMPIILKAAFKPTPSISQKQDTVNFVENENASIEIVGRHDPCVVPRAVPVVEAVVALALLDALLEKTEL